MFEMAVKGDVSDELQIYLLFPPLSYKIVADTSSRAIRRFRLLFWHCECRVLWLEQMSFYCRRQYPFSAYAIEEFRGREQGVRIEFL